MAERRLPAFESPRVEVARKFVRGERVLDRVEWDQERNLDLLAQEVVELHSELQRVLDTKQDSDRVQHLGRGVYVQHHVLGLGRGALKGSPCTITREESRSSLDHALHALQSEYSVAVTGQSGIGNTGGSMMHAIQYLLYRQAAVLYVGYKSEEMVLFLPNEDGKYRVWIGTTDDFSHSRFKREQRVAAVIDPRVEGAYSSIGKCRILKFASSNAEKHFLNWEKDGVVLVTSMPSDKEMLGTTQVLWDEEKSPHPWQISEPNTMEEKLREVEKRNEVVRAIPRLVFTSELFGLAIRGCLQGAEVSTEKLSDSDVYTALRGRYRRLLERHAAYASSRVFFLSPKMLTFRTWKERAQHPAAFQRSPIAALVLRDRLEDCVEVLRKDKFEDFELEWLCKKQGRKAEIQYVSDADHATASQRIASVDEEEQLVYRPATSNFPFIDFATRKTTWYNAKSISKDTKTVPIDEDRAQNFLDNLKRLYRTSIPGMKSQAY